MLPGRQEWEMVMGHGDYDFDCCVPKRCSHTHVTPGEERRVLHVKDQMVLALTDAYMSGKMDFSPFRRGLEAIGKEFK
jgi:hypothetical protein